MFEHQKFRMLKYLFLFSMLLVITTHSVAQSPLDKLLNDARTAYDQGQWETAIDKSEEAYKLAQKENNRSKMGLAVQTEALALIKNAKRFKNNRKKATELLHESLSLFNTTTDKAFRLESLEALSELALNGKDPVAAANYESQIELLQSAESTNENLTEAMRKVGQQQAMIKLKDQQLSRLELETELVLAREKLKVDSLKYRSERDSLALVQSNLLVNEQAAVLELQKSRNTLYIVLLVLAGLLAVAIFFRYAETKKMNAKLEAKNQIIEAERNKSEALLLNILPKMVANELKLNGVAMAKRYEQVTVLFSDFVNFTSISDRMTPEALVEMLDDYFKTFDAIITRHGLEKIKTIGDAYMCVGGMPEEIPNHAELVVNAALEIQQTLAKKQYEYEVKGRQFFMARVGIHTGPVVSGVVGSKKFAFDIWGDTVNVAARMEQTSESGKVNISAATYHQVKDRFAFISRGALPVKNKGEIGMYFVETKL